MQRKELTKYPLEDITIVCKFTRSFCEQHSMADDQCLGTCIHCSYANCAIIVDNGVAYFVTLEDEVNDTAPLVTITT